MFQLHVLKSCLSSPKRSNIWVDVATWFGGDGLQIEMRTHYVHCLQTLPKTESAQSAVFTEAIKASISGSLESIGITFTLHFQR